MADALKISIVSYIKAIKYQRSYIILFSLTFVKRLAIPIRRKD
jgi:hypothetical protein